MTPFLADRRAALGLGLAAALAGCTSSLATRQGASRAAPALWGPLPLGPYDPGLAVTWHDAGGRRLQEWHWFPARPGSGAAMTVGGLGRLYVAGGPPGWPADPLAVTATGYDEPGQDNGAARFALLAVASRLGARRAAGAFPLVVLGQGIAYESPFWQHDLAEYLASWGYDVRTAPLTGPDGGKPEVTPATLDAQVADLAWLARRAAPRQRLALLGFDLGGMAVIALAGSGRVDPEVVIGIDSGVIGEALMRDLVESRPDFAWANLAMPYVHFTRSAAENAARNLPEMLRILEDAAGAPRAMVRVPGMRHADFAAIGAIEHVFPAFFGPVAGSPGLGRANALDLVRQALDHWTGREAGAWTPRVQAPLTVQQW